VYGVVSVTQRGWTDRSTERCIHRREPPTRGGCRELGPSTGITECAVREIFSTCPQRVHDLIISQAVQPAAEVLEATRNHLHGLTDGYGRKLILASTPDNQGASSAAGAWTSSLASSPSSRAAVRGFEKSPLRDTRHWTSPSGAKG
jgi:hypothetical protein